MTDAPHLPAGDYGPWLSRVVVAIRDGATSDVPCGTCTACCTSGQFVHIAPDEADTIAHVPPALTFPAPGAPAGHVVLGYDERGHCPMLVGGACSIYEHRPRACRVYDCRVLAAAGVEVADKPAIAARVRQWRFGLSGEEERTRDRAVRAAARYLAEHPEVLSAAGVAGTGTQRAVMAIEIHEHFLAGAEPDPAALAAVLRRPPAPGRP